MNKRNNQQNIDGFTVRRRKSGGDLVNRGVIKRPQNIEQFIVPRSERVATDLASVMEVSPEPETRGAVGLKRADIDEALNSVDVAVPKKIKKHRFRKISKKKLIPAIILLLLVVGVGYFVTKFVLTTGRMFSGNVFDVFGSGVELKEDENGRTNILVFGTSEDDPGHNGADLTDSIMILSIDQEKKQAAMVSMPRDMWVDYGEACISGYSGKINVVYMCGAENGDEARGSTKLKDKVGEVFGLDVQYYAHVNYTVVREVVNALGGVTVNIESDDPRGIYDGNMGDLLRLPNGPANLSGEQALALARARGEGGGYGLASSNFDREENQQKLLIAIRDKALSGGVLANPIAVNGIIDALGNNLHTNFSAGEVKTLMQLAKDIQESSVVHISLVDEAEPMVTTGSYSGQSIVKPVDGIGVYAGIQNYIKKRLIGGEIVTENATIEVLNASTRIGIAKIKSDELAAAGLVNVSTGDTSYASQTKLTWYDLTGGNKPKTSAKLVSTLDSQSAGKVLPTGVQSDADFVIILGD